MAESVEVRLTHIERKLGIDNEQFVQSVVREFSETLQHMRVRLDRIENRLNGGAPPSDLGGSASGISTNFEQPEVMRRRRD